MGLKFEHNNEKLKLTVKNRTKILTKEFAFALSIAFLVHFLAITLFHIDLGLFSTTREYPAALVQTSDISPIDSNDQENPLTIPSFLVVSPEYHPSIYEINSSPHQTSFDLSGLEVASLNQPGSSHYYLSSGNSFEKEPAPLQSKKICKAKLEFKTVNGKIFWLDWLESTQDRKLDYQIVEALKKAELNPIASHGLIEIEFKS